MQSISRRNFIKLGAVAGSVPLFNIIPSTVLGKNAPSNRISLAAIGLGWQGHPNTMNFMGLKDVNLHVVCDINTAKMSSIKRKIDRHYGNKDCLMIRDFRELCQRSDIDAVMLAVPDHWHAYVAAYAASHGKDIYGEKPFTHDLREGRALVNAIERYGRVWQTGSWQRSSGEMRRAVELVRNGRIGKVVRVEVGLPSGRYSWAPKPNPNAKVPDTLDWDFWLGPAPYRPFVGIYDIHWRWVMEWGGGQLMDWIGHHADIAQWGLGRDRSGPVSFEGYAPFEPDGIYDSPKEYYVKCRYADGVELVVANDSKVRAGTTWYGENGDWIWVNRGNFNASKASIRESRIEAGELRLFSPGHFRNFIDCVKTRETSLTPAEVAHRSASIGHLGMIAIKTGHKIQWDPEQEKIINDPAASRFLGRTPRGPWALC